MRLSGVALVAVVLLSGCSDGPPSDPAAVAVREAHASVAAATLAVQLRLDQRSTEPYTRVLLATSRDAVADAQRELVTADDVDPARRETAAPVVVSAAEELSALTQAGVAALAAEDLQRLQALERELDGVATELGR